MTLVIQQNVQHNADDYDLDPEVLRGLWAMEERHFWHAARNRWIARALRDRGVHPPATILDVGCGAGAVAHHLLSLGYRVTGVDTAQVLVRKAHERCPDGVFICGDVGSLPAGVGGFDAVCFLDVLEHLDDPLSLMRSSFAAMRADGLVVATVPAQRALHTVIDDLSGHKKRFEVGELAQLLSDAGLQSIEERGIFRSTGQIQMRFRSRAKALDAARMDTAEKRTLMIANFKIPNGLVNRALLTLCRIEEALFFRRALGKSGASLIATGRIGVSQS